MSDLSHLDWKTSLVLYDARRKKFLKSLRVGIERLKAQVLTCHKYLTNDELVEHREARIKLTAMQEDAQNLVYKFLKLRNDQKDNIKKIVTATSGEMSAEKKSELLHFKNCYAENVANNEMEEYSLMSEFANFKENELVTVRKRWYAVVPNARELKEVVEVNTKAHELYCREGNDDSSLDTRREEFLKSLREEIDLLKAQVGTCDNYLKNFSAARIKLLSMRENTQNLIYNFLNSRNDRNCRIEEIVKEARGRKFVNEKFEMSIIKLFNRFLYLNDKAEENNLIKEFIDFHDDLKAAHESWYAEFLAIKKILGVDGSGSTAESTDEDLIAEFIDSLDELSEGEILALKEKLSELIGSFDDDDDDDSL